MKHKLIIILLFFSITSNAQDFSALWKGHFSYLNVVDVVEGNNKIYVASENAVFSYDTETFQIEEVSTIEGLSGEFISTLHYSETFEQLIIGYQNGLIEIYLERTNDVLTVVDILEEQAVPPNRKRINHFNEYNGSIFIATDYGISEYDLERLEFLDSFFIGDGGGQIIVTQTAIFEDRIYASCMSNSGIRSALVASNNLIDFQQWTQINGGNFLGIETVGSNLYTIATNRVISDISTTNVFTQLFTYNNNPIDIKSENNNLIITTRSEVFVYDSDFNILATATPTSEFNTQFTSATTSNEEIYIGTAEFGALRSTIFSPLIYTEIHPNGPLRNDTFSVQSGGSNTWVTYGDYDIFFNPSPLREFGFSHLNQEVWNNIPFEDTFDSRNLNAISVNPENPSQIFISSFQDGILEVNNGIPTQRLDETNSGLESLMLPGNPNFRSLRVSGTTFDNQGFLWSVTSLISSPLKYFNQDTNTWRSFDFTPIIQDPISDELGFSDLVIDNSGTKFIGSFRSGVIGFNENGNDLKNIFDEDTANLPSPSIEALAVDNRNQLWIGTRQGLRVLFNTSSFFTEENIRTEAIVILDDGIPRELLEEQFISDIKVDGSNNKWIATVGAGVFLFSPDGQETLFHFNVDNSPLPSNNVNDIAIDSDNGVVYFATQRGLVSFEAGGSNPVNNLSEAFIYPNPVRPNFDLNQRRITIKDISENVNIKITDIEGNLVAEAESRTNSRFRGFNLEIDGGTALWNGKNLANNTVRSGVYLILLSDLDTFETKVLKLLIIR
ncbi:ABC transporter substrate-binding protein [Flavobacteriaceae bacterium AU392]|nr:ABC transporter substrate-binding protein [Flavobacteriaceae bacterium]RKM84685.1 ABC transporter substrate-binding protein [Flavobacteriaceae bacterium AU392]